MRTIPASVTLLALLLAAAAHAATPAQTCRSSKTKEAGNYAECIFKAEAKFALQGDSAARSAAHQRCFDKYVAKWAQIEGRAAGACPSVADQLPVVEHLYQDTGDVAAALSGATLAPQARPLATGQTGCWNASGQAIACAGTGQDGEVQSGARRAYVDNGDGTITDTTTGLMWEKLSDDTGIHDKDNVYTWANAFNYKIATLNVERFAGYDDWRVPNVTELQSLVSYGAVGPAVDAAFNTGCAQWCTVLNCSCTLGGATSSFWSSTVFQPYPTYVMSVFFYTGTVDRNTAPTQAFHVRAVRGGA
ncbi:DUF1566 domain-containing protein [Candidatus Binatia bacterium]|nr:DUF1566 domain-containing protein [Candidatus Binatia bacterium]